MIETTFAPYCDKCPYLEIEHNKLKADNLTISHEILCKNRYICNRIYHIGVRDANGSYEDA